MPFLDEFLASAPNWLILGGSAAICAVLALIVAAVTHRLYPVRADADAKRLADTVHASVVGFAVFILALGISTARSNLEQAGDIVEQEAFRIARLDRQLVLYGREPTAAARGDLLAYARSIVDIGWQQMARARNEGVPLTIHLIDRLESEIYGLQPASPMQEEMKPRLGNSLNAMEEQREARLEKATTSVTSLFWSTIFLFMVVAMVLGGRYPPTTQRRFLIASHMAALGLAMGMLIVLDAPFRGETSVSQAPLLRVIANLSSATGR